MDPNQPSSPQTPAVPAKPESILQQIANAETETSPLPRRRFPDIPKGLVFTPVSPIFAAQKPREKPKEPPKPAPVAAPAPSVSVPALPKIPLELPKEPTLVLPVRTFVPPTPPKTPPELPKRPIVVPPPASKPPQPAPQPVRVIEKPVPVSARLQASVSRKAVWMWTLIGIFAFVVIAITALYFWGAELAKEDAQTLAPKTSPIPPASADTSGFEADAAQ